MASKRQEILVAEVSNDRTTEILDILGDTDFRVSTVSCFEDLVDRITRNSGSLKALIGAVEVLKPHITASIRKIKETNPDLPIIVVVSSSTPSLERRVRQAGVYYYLLRPFERRELVGIVNSLMNKPRRRKRNKH